MLSKKYNFIKSKAFHPKKPTRRLKYINIDLHVTLAARRLTAISGGLHSGHSGFRIFCAKVSAVMALPVGTRMNSATQRYRNEGRPPKASPM